MGNGYDALDDQIDKLRERIRDLEVQLAEARAQGRKLQERCTELEHMCYLHREGEKEAQAEVERLNGLLKEIEEHPHCNATNETVAGCCKADKVLGTYMSEHDMSDWWIGCVEGHRCCAEIARRRNDARMP